MTRYDGHDAPYCRFCQNSLSQRQCDESLFAINTFENDGSPRSNWGVLYRPGL